MKKPERFKIVKIPTDNPTGIDIFSSQKILSLNSQICAANWMWDEWEKYHKWFVKEKCVLKEDLLSAEEIKKIVENRIKEDVFCGDDMTIKNYEGCAIGMAQALAKRIRGLKLRRSTY